MTLKPFRADGGDIGTGRIREIADNPYGDEEKCWLARRVLALLDELEAAERARDNWHTSFDNERFRADKLADAFKTEHEQLVMAYGALITQHVRANTAEARIAELVARRVRLPQRFDVQTHSCSEEPDGEWYARDDVLAELTAAGVCFYEEG